MKYLLTSLLSGSAGLFWFQKGKTQTIRGAQNLMGLLFFQMLFLSFRSMIGALFTFPAEHKMMLKVSLNEK